MEFKPGFKKDKKYGNILAEAWEKEEVIRTEIDLKHVEEARAKMP